jgi:hypothetical protein
VDEPEVEGGEVERGYPWIWDAELGTYRLDETARVAWTEGPGPQPLEGRYYEPPPGVFPG